MSDKKEILYSFTGADFKNLCESTLKEKILEMNEKYVLKVPTQQGGGFNPSPQFPINPGMQPNNDNNPPSQQKPDSNDSAMFPEPPESNDGGFDDMKDNGDEDEDSPRKSIEKTTGKLTQKIREYMQGNNEDTNEVCKYVLGMVISQAASCLSENEKQEIIKKINKATGDVPVDNENNTNTSQNTDNQQVVNNNQPGEGVNENSITMDDDTHDTAAIRRQGKTTQKKRPFMPKF